MDYNLAKELKEAGFPQGAIHTGGHWLADPKDNHFTELENIRNSSTKTLEGAKMLPSYMFKESIWSPSLSELIEACSGEKIYQVILNVRKNKSIAWVIYEVDTPESDEPDDEYGEGPTPEEAVARLWLALQGGSAPPNK